MKRYRRCTRRLILSLLTVSVFVPLFLLSGKHLHQTSDGGSTGNFEDLSTINYRKEVFNLQAVHEEEGIGVNEPPSLVYEDGNFSSNVSGSPFDDKLKSDEPKNSGANITLAERKVANVDTIDDDQSSKTDIPSPMFGGKGEYKEIIVQHERKVQSLSKRVTDEKVKEMRDQVIRARAYLNFAPPSSNSHLVKELKLRIKDLERALGDANKDSDISRRALLRSKAMEGTLAKAVRLYPDCAAMVKKLRAMTYNAEEQVRAQKNQVTFLVQLAGRTTPKGLHCLSMRLTAEYFALPTEKRKLPRLRDLHDSDSYHFAVFSDNVLACHVVVQSTISSAEEPERIIFHVVTDSLNYPAISLWFLLYPPGKATIEIQSIDDFKRLSDNYDITMQKENSPDSRYTSALNHLRFYLPDMFPMLNKIVLLDHDVVVQRDLSRLWSIDMKGKVNGAVETCQVDTPSFRRMDMLINFSDPMVARRFDVKACTWAFGMNIFDLQGWRRHSLTRDYEKYLHLGKKKPLWKAGSLPLGWATFYNRTVALDRRWHVLGLGSHSGVRQADIDQGAVIHYDGVMKPWLDIGFEKYKPYWRKHVNYSHPFLQQCNIQE